MRFSVRFFFLAIVSTVLIIGFASVAQDDDTAEACPALAEQALEAVGDNCDVMDRNSACYGYNAVASSFLEPVDDTYFNDPAERTELRIVETIRTAPMDVDLERWGVAVMNVQANVPNTLPGQAVTFILLGDAEIENDVAPEDITEVVDPIPVVTNVRANVRSGASTRNNVLGVADSGTEMMADAVNESHDWVRVVWREQVGWVSQSVIDFTDTLFDDLPVSDALTLTPMQAFYFSTGIGASMCNEAPDVIGIHSPEGLTVDLGMNGANINVGSFITLKKITLTQFILTIHQGHVVSETGDEGFSGQTMVGTLNEENGAFIEWLEVRDATEEELGFFDAFAPLLPDLGIDLPRQPSAGGTCGGFIATSPLGGLANGSNSFYWNPPTFNVDNYRVVVYNFGESRTASFETQGNETFVGGQLTQDVIGGGFDNFAWEVQALINGRVVCTTPRIENLQRASAPIPVGGAPGAPFSASWACAPVGTYSVEFFWSNLPAGENVTFTYNAGGVPYTEGPFTAPSGSVQSYTAGATAINAVATVSDGTVINLPGALTCL